MRRWTSWAAKNADGVVALAAATVIVALDLFSDVPVATVNTGILLVLGILAVAMLRDRVGKDTTMAQLERALRDTSMVEVLTWPELTEALAEARRSTNLWVFRGGTGTYTRAKTLPECVANARRDRRALQVRLEIIDPTNQEVCAHYARFRNTLAGDKTTWTVERTQRESYATIVACCWYLQRYALLDAHIGLSQVMPHIALGFIDQEPADHSRGPPQAGAAG